MAVCGVNTYSAAGATACSACPSGSTTTNSTGAATCVCNSGYTSNNATGAGLVCAGAQPACLANNNNLIGHSCAGAATMGAANYYCSSGLCASTSTCGPAGSGFNSCCVGAVATGTSSSNTGCTVCPSFSSQYMYQSGSTYYATPSACCNCNPGYWSASGSPAGCITTGSCAQCPAGSYTANCHGQAGPCNATDGLGAAACTRTFKAPAQHGPKLMTSLLLISF